MIISVVWVVLRHLRHSNTHSAEDPFLFLHLFPTQIIQIMITTINININDKVLDVKIITIRL